MLKYRVEVFYYLRSTVVFLLLEGKSLHNEVVSITWLFPLCFREDDDINDVTSMAGVNLSEESARILATNADFIGTQLRSIKEEKFLFTGPLQSKVNEICKCFTDNDVWSVLICPIKTTLLR